jgi:hypothetical protein
MGFRSKEALARRAEKRGLTPHAQMAKDDVVSRDRLKGELAEAETNKKAAVARRMKSTTLPIVMGGGEKEVKRIARSYMEPAANDAKEEQAPRPTSWTCPTCKNVRRPLPVA